MNKYCPYEMLSCGTRLKSWRDFNRSGCVKNTRGRQSDSKLNGHVNETVSDDASELDPD